MVPGCGLLRGADRRPFGVQSISKPVPSDQILSYRQCTNQHTSFNLMPETMQTTTPKSQVIYAPAREAIRGVKSIFLAGTTAKTKPDDRDWREVLSESLADTPVTILNPYRGDWDSTWREDIAFAPYREQVEWELDMQEAADIIVVFFHPDTQAPISLLELGLSARSGKCIVSCPEGYLKRGNVQIVCQRFGVEMVESVDELRDAILRRLPDDFTRTA
ncbi:Uu.00g130990.m01.CDS01 [Anthostomella pinea]|uniref:Uu.00g130990.m01.CDS01 n=1 Tax=Anthostomella pinea TaxID=933095 RepID=A0AAI8VIT3_9PEZI|nr:Uu.00g130990.m01.CDS01 [Anthostomella pinea]